MPQFSSLKDRESERVLLRAPLNYIVGLKSGSHRRFVAAGRPPLTFAYHRGATIPAGQVREILVEDDGLTEAQALELLGRETS